MRTTFVGTTNLYFIVQRWLRQRQAWQWWHNQQTARLHEQAEAIRDDLLQQTFAFRRYLESSLAAHPDVEQTQQWLDSFQLFYTTLERLSNQLSPPFIADSLPLALQFMAQTWQHTYKGLTVELDVPRDWSQASTDNNQVILSVIAGMIELVVPVDGSEQQVHITLRRQDTLCTLTFQQINQLSIDPASVANTPEIKHLKEIFCSLTAGQLEVSTAASGLMGQLRWHEM